MPFIVICNADKGEVPIHSVATHQIFDHLYDACRYAATIDKSREAKVVEVWKDFYRSNKDILRDINKYRRG